ncbi:developmentally regulated GTP-binding protein [Wallemia mellicola]|uniref:Developmentally regulated GTP-binding protein n=2 Tax=Wallemia mellicola TaxID=1708541 RepID=A0AB38MES9_9BASI|nr:developmentally regulated GTP-binding protein [Wallemia mellicola]TIB84021.1 developmentally regulated GTP-binding protein [Wallemia mellicola]TIB98395.1 developmentally regulated GTP-binding protein [Wallemia mellicola]TIC38285.1 developmentally regulated GTP-binding protein [Wallemia mellicola]TIC45478.1 developmentally regulated GTP-binding protein [Wallemia mellicola]
MGVLEKIQEIEGGDLMQSDSTSNAQPELRRIRRLSITWVWLSYHSRTHIYTHEGQLKAKLAKYRQQLLEPTTKSSKPGEGFDVMKSGDARIVMIGFPSVGKSTLLSKTTKTESATAAYEFTTAIPGVLEYEGTRIQLLDLPGIVEGASAGRGRGRQVVSVAKTADLVLMVLDATKSLEQRTLLEYELEAVGIRLNKKKPDVQIKRKKTGGVTINCPVELTKTDQRTLRSILQEYKIHNADVMIREDITADDFIDVVLGNRKYMNCLYAYNKIDGVSLEEVNRLAHQDHTVPISCEMDLNLDYLIERMWEQLDLLKVYTKRRGTHPDLDEPVCLRKGATIEHVCHSIHRSLAESFKYAIVWGKSSKFSPQPQKVSFSHRIANEDVVTIVA